MADAKNQTPEPPPPFLELMKSRTKNPIARLVIQGVTSFGNAKCHGGHGRRAGGKLQPVTPNRIMLL
jgi:hypothetical protein